MGDKLQAFESTLRGISQWIRFKDSTRQPAQNSHYRPLVLPYRFTVQLRSSQSSGGSRGQVSSHQAPLEAFLIGPDLIQFEMYRKEVAYAELSGKCIVPILIRNPDAELVPAALAEGNRRY